MSSSRTVIETSEAPAAMGPYSQAIRNQNLLFCSGQIPLEPDTGEIASNDIGQQTRRCLENLQAVCAEAGASLGDAVRITIYTTALESFSDINDACAEVFGEIPPARATVGVSALPKGAAVEIDAIVALA